MDGSDATPHYHLYRRSRTPVWLALSWRALLAFALIGIALAVHWFDRDGLRQSSGAPVTFADILYFTMITVTTVGYGDIYPVTTVGRLITMISALVGMAVIALPTGIITAAYMAEITKKKSKYEL